MLVQAIVKPCHDDNIKLEKILILCGQGTESESVLGNAMQIYDLLKNEVHPKKKYMKKMYHSERL